MVFIMVRNRELVVNYVCTDLWHTFFVCDVLVGGLEHFLFSIICGIILPIDFRIFQDGQNHQPV